MIAAIGASVPYGTHQVWFSADGLSWRRAAGIDEDEWPDMRAVTVAGDGRLVAGGGMFMFSSAGTWASQDRGETWVWHRHENPDDPDDNLFLNGAIQGLAVFGDEVLAVGSYSGGGDFFDAAVWVGRVNDTDG